MISIEEARKWVSDKCFELEEEWVSIDQSVGRVLSQDLLAPFDLPSFRNSAMDGYAMLRSDLDKGLRKFVVAGEIQAGKSDKITVYSGQSYRIFTGAVLPENSDVVVIQEKTDRGEDEVQVISYDSKDGNNIREIGEQIRKGAVALSKGHLINPASVGLMASFGVEGLTVYGMPNIGIITTGNELKKAGEVLSNGEIYESNSFSLKAALKSAGFNKYTELSVSDDFEKTKSDIGQLLKDCHVLILSGGISVGKYDFVKSALEANEVEEVFYKINQKPGKPMFFGVKDEKLVFALPGNPASLLVCFYEYVLPALYKIMGGDDGQIVLSKKLSEAYPYKGTRPEFLRGNYSGEVVTILEGQSSFMLKSFAEANCLVYLHGEKRLLSKGSVVEVHSIY